MAENQGKATPRRRRKAKDGKVEQGVGSGNEVRVQAKPGSLEEQYVRPDGTFRIGDWIDDLTED